MNVQSRFFALGVGLFLLVSITERAQARYDIPPASTPVQLGPDTKILKQISAAVSTISDSAKKALVFVSVSKTMQSRSGQIDPFEFFFGPQHRGGPRQRPRKAPRQEGLGSGFFIDLKLGYLLTNNHVIDGADTIHLKLANGESYDGKVIGRDANTDIAVVQVVDQKFKREGLSSLVLDDSGKVIEGSFAIALGAPFGLESSISFGVISAVGRGNLSITKLGDFLQTDAAINPGNSGGPLVGVDGKVIGINTAIVSKSGGYNGIGFAVPANLVRRIATALINDGSVQRGYIGVYFEPFKTEWAESLKIPAGTVGAIVSKTIEGGPAAKAGLESGDVVVRVDGKLLKSGLDFSNVVGVRKPNDRVKVHYYRNGKLRTTEVTIGAHPDGQPVAVNANGDVQGKAKNIYGLHMHPLTDELRSSYQIESRNGLVIVGVEKSSAAEQALLRKGDVILAINGRRITSVKQFEKTIGRQKKMILLHIERQGSHFFVSVHQQNKDTNG